MINFLLWWFSIGFIVMCCVRYKDGPMKLTEWLMLTIFWPVPAWYLLEKIEL